MSLKTENSRRVAKSRLVCMGLYGPVFGRVSTVKHSSSACQWSDNQTTV
jgi:hypothetical protein